MGCGSGVLSFIIAKHYKSAKVCAVDNNKYAVETCQVNAATFNLKNIEAFQHDITKIDDLEHNFRSHKCPLSYELIITNPPWLIGKRGQH